MSDVPLLAIGVFCTVMHDKYAAEVQACLSTWCNIAKECNVPVYFFAGYHRAPQFPDLIHLEGCQEDFQSATTKQYYGLKWLYDNCPAQSYMMVGSDTFPNITNLLEMVRRYDLSKDLYIGGDDMVRIIDGAKYKFHSGGSGFILTRSATEKITRIMDIILASWGKICSAGGAGYLLAACDVSVAYYCKHLDIDNVTEPYFHACNYLGKCGEKQCCLGVDKDKIVSCHYMTPNDMISYYQYLCGQK